MLVEVFERFTEGARRVLVLAQEEASRLHHNFIGTEHILLGLLCDDEGIAADTLKHMGITLEAARGMVSRTVGPVEPAAPGSPPFTPRAKKVLEFSLREALQLGHTYIGPEHMLLGLLREGEGVAVQVLVGLGADLITVRRQVVTRATGGRPEEAGHPPRDSAAEVRSGPRCPACRSELDGRMGYRVLPVGAVDPSSGPETRDFVFVYCLRCGVVVASTPATPLKSTDAPGV